MTALTPPTPALVRPDPETVGDWSQGVSRSERQVSARLLGAQLRLAAFRVRAGRAGRVDGQRVPLAAGAGHVADGVHDKVGPDR